ncbi:NUDIX domain-containing protein [Humidisolicoccus flavus]|uniref:NUDIX domain-containing protein n=1 Tax=Humidisolicoccus flavus TaxID=3111414 RepID=UPI00324FA669
MGWKTLQSTTVYENRWMKVREDDVIGPAGKGIYGVVEMQHPAVFVVALDHEDRVCLVTLERYTLGAHSTEVPAGGTDGEDPLLAAQRELREEAGIEAREWTAIGSMTALNGLANAPEHVFLARDLHEVNDSGVVADTQLEEGISAVQWVPFAETLQMVARGEITDGESVAALAYAGIHLGRFQ